MQNVSVGEFESRLTKLIEEYIFNVKEEFHHLWNAWEIDINHKEIHEVIGGMIARQISIAVNFMISTSNWNNEIAPIILRSMTDNYINFAWILKSPTDRVQKFIFYGLGQEKLVMEHRKNQMKNDGIELKDDPMASASKKWIDFQNYDFLTSVDLGNWSKLSVYDMAVEADCKDFYNYVYQPFSVAAHNMWNHIGKHNVQVSENPLHKLLLVPTVPIPELIWIYPELAAKYVEKFFTGFHEKFNIKRHKNIAYHILQVSYENLLNDFNLTV